MFAFPIYEHNGARHLVRYLLLRGILAEEIADAIADSTVDLQTWLNRGGRYMVGEWVIAWINESREEYETEKRSTRGQWMQHDVTSLLDWVSESNGNGSDTDSLMSVAAGVTEDDIEFYGALPNPLVASVRTLNDDTDEGDIETAAEVQVMALSPPPQRGLNHPTNVATGQTDHYQPKDNDPVYMNNVTMSYTTPELLDSSSAPEQYTDRNCDKDSNSQPDNTHNAPNLHTHNNTAKKSTQSRSNHPSHYKTNSTLVSNNPECNNGLNNGTINGNLLAQNKGKSNGQIPNGNAVGCKDVPRTLACHRSRTSWLHCPLRIPDTIVCSMPLNLETQTHDGPGYMFVMTDPSYNDGATWAVEHRYKIASSRQPNRWLTEFHTRNVAIEIIWRVKVGRHLEAMKEVYKNLTHFHVYANWFQCSLCTLIQQLSEVANKYKTSA